MSKLNINGKSFDVHEDVSKEFSKIKSKLNQVQDWINQTDSLVNGCGIEEEYYELSKIMYDESE